MIGHHETFTFVMSLPAMSWEIGWGGSPAEWKTHGCVSAQL